jgi:hypothetical protein
MSVVTHDKFSEIITTMALLVRPCTLVHKRMPKPSIHGYIYVTGFVVENGTKNLWRERMGGMNPKKL